MQTPAKKGQQIEDQIDNEIDNNIRQSLVDNIDPSEDNKTSVDQTTNQQYQQTKYRWIILAISGGAMMLNGLLNNIIMPLQSKIAATYDYSQSVVNSAIIISFLAFCFMNVPANFIIDAKGIKIGYLIGTGFYSAGMLCCCFVNQAFPLLIFGYILVALGQPFILNCPAKIASYWFFPQNRSLATSILVGCNILGNGLGFVIPVLVVSDTNKGEQAKMKLLELYVGYSIAAFCLFTVTFLFFKKQPKIPPSNIVKHHSIGLKETIREVKKDRNLWCFMGGYWLIYGTFLTFASTANFLMSNYDFSDLNTSLCAVFLILFGVVGAILSSFFLKKYDSFRKLTMIICIGIICSLSALIVQLSLLWEYIFFSAILTSCLGFFLTPIVPVSYELGCEIGFPIGQAQITGLLNGGSLVWAFICDNLMTFAVGLDTRTKSFINLLLLLGFVLIGCLLYMKTKIDLKRRKYEKENHEGSETSPQKMTIQMRETAQTEDVSKEMGSPTKVVNFQLVEEKD